MVTPQNINPLYPYTTLTGADGKTYYLQNGIYYDTNGNPLTTIPQVAQPPSSNSLPSSISKLKAAVQNWNPIQPATAAITSLLSTISSGTQATIQIANEENFPVNLSALGQTTLNTAIASAGTTTLVVTNFTAFPGAVTGVAQPFTIQVGTEQMTVTAGFGTTSWTVTRGVNGTTALASILSGTPISLVTTFIIQVLSEQMLVTAGFGATTWAVSRGYNGTTALASAPAGAPVVFVPCAVSISVINGAPPQSNPIIFPNGAVSAGAWTRRFHQCPQVWTPQQAFLQNWGAILTAAITSTGQTALSVTTAFGNEPLAPALPSLPFVAYINQQEYVLVTNIVGSTWTVTRGYAGSTAQASIAVGSQLVLFQNLFYTTLNGAITAGQTTITVNSNVNFPTANGFFIVVGLEVMQVTAGAGTLVWTVTRGINLNGTGNTGSTGAGVTLLGDSTGKNAASQTTSIVVDAGLNSGLHYATEDAALCFMGGFQDTGGFYSSMFVGQQIAYLCQGAATSGLQLTVTDDLGTTRYMFPQFQQPAGATGNRWVMFDFGYTSRRKITLMGQHVAAVAINQNDSLVGWDRSQEPQIMIDSDSYGSMNSGPWDAGPYDEMVARFGIQTWSTFSLGGAGYLQINASSTLGVAVPNGPMRVVAEEQLIKAYGIDAIAIFMGINDTQTSVTLLPQFTTACQTYLTEWRRAAPNAHIFVSVGFQTNELNAGQQYYLNQASVLIAQLKTIGGSWTLMNPDTGTIINSSGYVGSIANGSNLAGGNAVAPMMTGSGNEGVAIGSNFGNSYIFVDSGGTHLSIKGCQYVGDYCAIAFRDSILNL